MYIPGLGPWILNPDPEPIDPTQAEQRSIVQQSGSGPQSHRREVRLKGLPPLLLVLILLLFVLLRQIPRRLLLLPLPLPLPVPLPLTATATTTTTKTNDCYTTTPATTATTSVAMATTSGTPLWVHQCLLY